MVERRLDKEAIEAAEFARKNDRVAMAAEIAAIGLGITSSSLTHEEVAELSLDPEQRAVLACLARIHVGSLNGVANKSINPARTLSASEGATKTINAVFRDPTFDEKIREVTHDHRGREHHFWAEAGRDMAKTMFTASVLYYPSRSDALTDLGERTLQTTYDALPEGHPTKPLIGVELQLSGASRGERIDREAIKQDFRTLKEMDEENNPHRVATVASWLVAWGEKLKDEELAEIGMRTFTKIINSHTEWEFMTDKERKKIVIQQIRRLAFRLLTPMTTNQKRREDLYTNLTKGRNMILSRKQLNDCF